MSELVRRTTQGEFDGILTDAQRGAGSPADIQVFGVVPGGALTDDARRRRNVRAATTLPLPNTLLPLCS